MQGGELSYTDVNWKRRYHTKKRLCVDNEKQRGQDEEWKTEGAILSLHEGPGSCLRREEAAVLPLVHRRDC